MAVKTEKKYTVADLYKEAGLLLTEEMEGLNQRRLTDEEQNKMNKLAKALSNTILKEMKVL